jgi:hypothetical protein
MKSENKKTGVSFSLSSGIKKTGGFEPAIEPDSFHGIDFTNNFNVSTYPIENGGFASYNKIHTPFNLKVTVAVGGDDAKKEKFISTLDAMSNSIEYFGLITPAGTYKNLTVERYDYKRELKNGLGILVVAISFVQIMEAISTTAQAGKVGSPATPSASPSQSLGNTSGAVKP